MELAVVLLAVSVVLVGLMAGLFFAYSVSVVLTLETLSATAYTRVIQSINDVILNPVFAVAFVGAAVVPLITAVIVSLRGDWTTPYGQLVLVGTGIYLVGTAGETMGIHVPMNEYTATWSQASPPNDWSAIRARWALWNHVRTTAAIISFVVLLVALVVRLTSADMIN